MFLPWSRCRDGTIKRAGLKSSPVLTRCAVAWLLLQRGLQGRHGRTAEVRRELYCHRELPWPLLEHDGVHPTNNAAERSLRPAVICHELSFGTQRAAGGRFVKTLLNVIETCGQPDCDQLSLLANTLTRHPAQRRHPSLLSGA